VLPSCATSRGRSPIRHLGTRVAAVVPRQVSLSLTRADNHDTGVLKIYRIQRPALTALLFKRFSFSLKIHIHSTYFTIQTPH